MSGVQVTYKEQEPSPYAGFWRRVGASAIDGLILLVPIALIMAVFWPRAYSIYEPARFSFIFYLLMGALIWGYRVYFESSPHMATPGKMALGIVVTDLTGEAIPGGTATLRNWVYWLPSAVAIMDNVFGSWKFAGGMGFFGLLASLAVIISCAMVAFTERKQGWHDIMAKCLVIRKGAIFKQGPLPEPKPPSVGSSPAEKFMDRWGDIP